GTVSWGAERVADPFVRATVEHHRVEAAARPGSLAERIQQVALRGAPQARLLAVADARCGTAEGAGAPPANLHEDERISVAHDQGDLADLVAHVGRDEAESGSFEEAPRRRLGVLSRDLPGGGAHRAPSGPLTAEPECRPGTARAG